MIPFYCFHFIIGCFRGLYVGGLWGCFFHRYDVPTPSPGVVVDAAQLRTQALKMRLGESERNRACRRTVMQDGYAGQHSGSFSYCLSLVLGEQYKQLVQYVMRDC